jgi:hypothetical protein
VLPKPDTSNDAMIAAALAGVQSKRRAAASTMPAAKATASTTKAGKAVLPKPDTSNDAMIAAALAGVQSKRRAAANTMPAGSPATKSMVTTKKLSKAAASKPKPRAVSRSGQPPSKSITKTRLSRERNDTSNDEAIAHALSGKGLAVSNKSSRRSH